jgi:hypothetical protein
MHGKDQIDSCETFPSRRISGSLSNRGVVSRRQQDVSQSLLLGASGLTLL